MGVAAPTQTSLTHQCAQLTNTCALLILQNTPVVPGIRTRVCLFSRGPRDPVSVCLCLLCLDSHTREAPPPSAASGRAGFSTNPFKYRAHSSAFFPFSTTRTHARTHGRAEADVDAEKRVFFFWRWRVSRVSPPSPPSFLPPDVSSFPSVIRVCQC